MVYFLPTQMKYGFSTYQMNQDNKKFVIRNCGEKGWESSSSALSLEEDGVLKRKKTFFENGKPYAMEHEYPNGVL